MTRRHALLAAAIAALMGPAASAGGQRGVAQTSAALPGAEYAGGTFGRRGPRTAGEVLLGGRVAPDAASLRLRVTVRASCGTMTTEVRPRVAPDGSFWRSGRGVHPTSDGYRGTLHYFVIGRIDGPAASGQLRARLTYTRRGRRAIRCATGARAWQLRSGGPDPNAEGPPARGIHYGMAGVAPDGLPNPLLLRVSSDGSRFAGAVFRYVPRCTFRSSAGYLGVLDNTDLPPSGSFQTGFLRWERFRRVRIEETTRAVGRVSSQGATGRLRATTVYRDWRGRRRALVHRCRSGWLAWSARP